MEREKNGVEWSGAEEESETESQTILIASSPFQPPLFGHFFLALSFLFSFSFSLSSSVDN